jgi:uncharacterized protein
MIFIDTSYLWALIDKRDQLHARAAAWQSMLNEPLLTTEYVLLEMVNGFSLPNDRLLAHAAIEDIITSQDDWLVINASSQRFEEGIRLHKAHNDKSWSLTDCIPFNVMRDRGTTRALTHDHHFEQAGFEALLRRDPP